jgi:hypothetical protein
MSSVEASNAAGEIDQPVAINIFNYCPLRPSHKDGGGLENRLHHGGVPPLH